MTELQKCLKAIYLELPEVVADDVNRIVKQEIEQLQAQLKQTLEALEFYGCADSYQGRITTDNGSEWIHAAPVKEDKGKEARHTLATINAPDRKRWEAEKAVVDAAVKFTADFEKWLEDDEKDMNTLPDLFDSVTSSVEALQALEGE